MKHQRGVAEASLRGNDNSTSSAPYTGRNLTWVEVTPRVACPKATDQSLAMGSVYSIIDGLHKEVPKLSAELSRSSNHFILLL